MDEKILKILDDNSDLPPASIAGMLQVDVSQVIASLERLKKQGTILKNKTIINWENTSREIVTAYIELKVTPQRGEGFDRIAERIYQYPEVTSLYLMSGGYDLGVTIQGRTMKDTALFVAERLAPMEFVLSTATHFVLKKYKEHGVIFERPAADERGLITL